MAQNPKSRDDIEMGDCARADGRRSEEREQLSCADSGTSRVSRKMPLRSALSVRTTYSKYEKCSHASEYEQTDAGLSVSRTPGTGCWKAVKAHIADFFSDMFGSEFDFGAAYRRAKGLGDGFQSSVTTRTDQQEQVRAWEHLKFFPLTFKDNKFETQYGLICSQLFIGRLFLVLIALIFIVIPVIWLLASFCFVDVDLETQSYGAWVAFHTSFAINLGIASVSLALTIFPKIIPVLRRYFELYAYVNVLAVSCVPAVATVVLFHCAQRAFRPVLLSTAFMESRKSVIASHLCSLFVLLQWLCITLIVLATFPALVKVPEQMEMLWTADTAQVAQIVAEGHPVCSQISTGEGLKQFLTCLQAGTQTSTCVGECQNDLQCVTEVFTVVATGAEFCQSMAAAVGKHDVPDCRCFPQDSPHQGNTRCVFRNPNRDVD